MLELSGLLIGPWTPPGDPWASPRGSSRAPGRLVLDPGSRKPIGVVRARARTWPGWLGRKEQEVCESQDDSLLCLVRGPWLLSWAWEVHDAEERRVAVLRGPEILDGFGRPLAILQPGNARSAGKILGTHGQELAEWAVQGDEFLLQFAPALSNEPLIKMALLGMLLSQL